MSRSALLVALALFIIVPTHALAAEVLGYVDMQKVLEESKLGKRLQDQLREEFEPRGQEMAAEEQEIRKLQQSLERDAPLMSADQVSKQEADVQKRIAAFQEKANGIQQEIMKVQQAKSREIIGPARDSISAVAKKNKIGMVVEPGMSGVLYLDEKLDLTAEVVKHLDANTK
ncbi:OmpH family outer membrane protein [Thiocapsa roseopersicina]|uniref:Periplasmic chaperone for outer membrane proteins Skp n=1 Tax=Thiocapsa roseopersicina TaxID=1058 RepID=A0A1H3AEY3_THIRO|nr:OmpH family outer membrane protein [Thiocapsa roseopersicina]SDX28031.1 periplasmic chaperone for outer membrane proteins Skp [Thiocapsa roseopersicina]